MLRKPSAILSSYSHFYNLYYSSSNPAGAVSTSHCYIHPPRPFKERSIPFRYYATVNCEVDELPWPKLPSSSAIPTPYQILCAQKGEPYYKGRFYELVKIYHPDRNGHEHANAKWRAINGTVKMERYRMIVTAHDILSDPAKREAYDACGAGWNGRPEHEAPKYEWGQCYETNWSVFDTNDSPFKNATWEDWERWYQRDKIKQEPLYVSNGGFLVLVITAIFLGAFGQSSRVGDNVNLYHEQIEKAHEDASKILKQRKGDSASLGNKNDRLQNFLKTRDPLSHPVAEVT